MSVGMPSSASSTSSPPTRKSLGVVRRAASVGGDNGGGMIGHRSALSLSPDYYSFHDTLRGGSADAGSSHTATTSSSGDSSAWSAGHHHSGGNNFNDIFRDPSSRLHRNEEVGACSIGVVVEEVTQSRNESSEERLRSLRSRLGSNESLSDSLMLLLRRGGDEAGQGRAADDPAHHLDPRALSALDDDSRARVESPLDGTPVPRLPLPSSSSGFVDDAHGIFRRRGYSPIIGTPTRGGGARKDLLNWGRSRAISNEGLLLGGGGGEEKEMEMEESGSIRPSLSCPTSVFESPLFPSSPSSPPIPHFGKGGDDHRSLYAHSFGGYHHTGLNNLGGPPSRVGGGKSTADGLMLSRPYRLEKIQSASAEPSPSHASDDVNTSTGDDSFRGVTMILGGDDDGPSSPSDEEDDLVDGGDRDDDGDRLESVDVSAIECECDEDSPFRDASATDLDGIRRRSLGDPLAVAGDAIATTASVSSGGPRRKLSDAFDLLVLEGGGGGLPEQHVVAEAGDTTVSSFKSSPTSVSAVDGETTSGTLSSDSASRGSASSTLQLENGLTVALISMPHFHLHETLRGTLSQGLVDRVSFYSVVRDINKEALDAAMIDPKGGVYNDGTVHGNETCASSSTDAAKQTLIDGKHQVIAEDGKIHVHPNPKQERNSVLVVACLSEEKNPNEPNHADDLPESEGSTSGNPSNASSPSLGAALLDEEWWLMSAIASRSPDEVSINRSTKLLPTFHEAIGEKDCVVTETPATVTSRTQLWKPGRSWWEAKSGKNPWVEPVVHNNRWRYLWPLIHYHKFIAKCIKKLKRNGIDVKNSMSTVSLFLRQEVCNVSDHLAFMSKYDSEEWTSALSHFESWTDHDPNVEATLRTLVASQKLSGLAETTDAQSSLLRSQIDDKILKAMQLAKDEAGRDAYDYKDAPAKKLVEIENESSTAEVGEGSASFSQRQQRRSAQDNSYTLNPVWMNESHLRSAIESKKRSMVDASWSNRSENSHYPPLYPHQGAYMSQYHQHSTYGPPGYGQHYMDSHYYPPHQYHGYGQYSPHRPHVGYHHHGNMSYNDPLGHHHQYYSGFYHPSDGSFHEGMVFDNSMHSHDPYMHPSIMTAQTPERYNGSNLHSGHYPASPYWGHLNISQLPGVAASPSIHITPSKPPRGSHSNRSFRKRQQQGTARYVSDGRAKSLIMFSNQTNSPASRFVMSSQDKSNPYYKSETSQASMTESNNDGKNAARPSLTLNHSTCQEESFVLPTIEDYSPESPADKAGGHANLHSNTSLDLMPPSVKKMYMKSSHPSKRQDVKLSEVLEARH
ncbi:hypothetical protein ACHAXA_007893 [Cyclostephanos tholiformis]|uniref:Uncharacterized protein n=1 Tax=Cyclostephanos tholiformis TaxID=382380 RepID=A0ABD3SH70_9STRA